VINCGDDDDSALAPHSPLPRPQAERAAGWPEASLPAIGSPVPAAVRATFRCPELPGGFLCDVYSAFWARLGEEVARARLVTSICGHVLGALPISVFTFAAVIRSLACRRTSTASFSVATSSARARHTHRAVTKPLWQRTSQSAFWLRRIRHSRGSASVLGDE